MGTATKNGKARKKDLSELLVGETPARLTIEAADMRVIAIAVQNTSPLVMNKFSHKAMEEIRQTQMAGSTAQKNKKRDPKDFDAAYERAKHLCADDGWCGIPSMGIQKAMVAACRLCGFRMTNAKQAFSVIPDGFDDDGMGLTRIYGEPEPKDIAVRNANKSCDLRRLPMWKEWTAKIRIEYDASVFTEQDLVNLLSRAGRQCGVLEGRPTASNGGMGWGKFEIMQEPMPTAAEVAAVQASE